LKVAVLTRHFSPDAGGAEHYAVKLVEQLAHLHEVHVFAQHINHSWPGVTYHHISTPLKRPRWLNQLWFSHETRRATLSGFDIVHSHENTSHGNVQSVHVIPLWINYFGLGSMGSRAHSMSTLKRFAKVVLALLSPRLLSYLWLEWVRLRPLPNKLVLGVSSALSAELSSVFRLDASHLKTLIPGVQSSEQWAKTVHTDPVSIELADLLCQNAPLGGAHKTWLQASDLCSPLLKAQAQRGLQLEPQLRQWLLWVGHDARKKGLPALLDAMLVLPDDIGLMLVGKSALSEQTQMWIDQRGLSLRVRPLGVMRDVAPAYMACDVLVHPTLEDTFAMAVVEAMAWARAVVVSPARYCGVAQELLDREHVLKLEDPRDARDIARKVLVALSDATRLGSNALEWTRMHGWSDQALELNRHYQDLVSRETLTP
jgi:UDP-glucose:(heptosyl)LPS alpha-1,3-glucosyltransferase